MRRRSPASVKALAAACTTIAVSVGVGAALASSSQPAAGSTFTLQNVTACAKPATVLGRACVDRSREIATWTVGDGSAGRVVPGQWTQSFTWNVPKTISPDGKASMTLGLKATWTSPGSGQICPAITVTGGFASKQLLKCAESGKPADGSLPVKLVPPSAAAGTIRSLTVSLLDGPVYTYTYRAGAAAATPKCPKPPRLPASVRAEKKCDWQVRYSFGQHRVIPDVSESTSAGSGYFRITPDADRACGSFGGSLFNGVHQDEQITRDVRIVLVEGERIHSSCLAIKQRGGQVIALVVTVDVVVKASSDSGCPVDETGTVVVRAGEPFPYVIFDVCNHHHIYSPPRGRWEKQRSVRTKIIVNPAGPRE